MFWKKVMWESASLVSFVKVPLYGELNDQSISRSIVCKSVTSEKSFWENSVVPCTEIAGGTISIKFKSSSAGAAAPVFLCFSAYVAKTQHWSISLAQTVKRKFRSGHAMCSKLLP